MSTGDVNGNIQKLVDHLYAIAYPIAVSARCLRQGDPTALLPILHYTLLDYSPSAADWVGQMLGGEALSDADDATFTEMVLRLAPALGLRPHMTAAQFLALGFVERKLLFLVDVIRAVQRLDAEATAAGAAGHSHTGAGGGVSRPGASASKHPAQQRQQGRAPVTAASAVAPAAAANGLGRTAEEADEEGGEEEGGVGGRMRHSQRRDSLPDAAGAPRRRVSDAASQVDPGELGLGEEERGSEVGQRADAPEGGSNEGEGADDVFLAHGTLLPAQRDGANSAAADAVAAAASQRSGLPVHRRHSPSPGARYRDRQVQQPPAAEGWDAGAGGEETRPQGSAGPPPDASRVSPHLATLLHQQWREQQQQRERVASATRVASAAMGMLSTPQTPQPSAAGGGGGGGHGPSGGGLPSAVSSASSAVGAMEAIAGRLLASMAALESRLGDLEIRGRVIGDLEARGQQLQQQRGAGGAATGYHRDGDAGRELQQQLENHQYTQQQVPAPPPQPWQIFSSGDWRGGVAGRGVSHPFSPSSAAAALPAAAAAVRSAQPLFNGATAPIAAAAATTASPTPGSRIPRPRSAGRTRPLLPGTTPSGGPPRPSPPPPSQAGGSGGLRSPVGQQQQPYGDPDLQAVAAAHQAELTMRAVDAEFQAAVDRARRAAATAGSTTSAGQSDASYSAAPAPAPPAGRRPSGDPYPALYQQQRLDASASAGHGHARESLPATAAGGGSLSSSVPSASGSRRGSSSVFGLAPDGSLFIPGVTHLRPHTHEPAPPQPHGATPSLALSTLTRHSGSPLSLALPITATGGSGTAPFSETAAFVDRLRGRFAHTDALVARAAARMAGSHLAARERHMAALSAVSGPLQQ